MDLSNRLRQWAMARPRVLIVTTAGNDLLRWHVEAEVARRGWQFALSPADTDILLTIGAIGPELSAAADVLWSQIPQPRQRLAVTGEPVGERLEAALLALGTSSAYQDGDDPATVLSRGKRAEDLMTPGAHGQHDGHDMAGHADHGATGAAADKHAGHDMGGHAGHDMGGHGAAADEHAGHDMGGHAGHDMGGHDMAGHADHGATGAAADEHAGHDMGGHAGHDMGGHGAAADEHAGHDMGGHAGHDMGGHGGHDMHGGEVAGLPMAGTAPDRDGLELDELKVTLGPVLPGWPGGLVLRGSMQGDVLTRVEFSWVDDVDLVPADPAGGVDRRAGALDVLTSFLLVAGWPWAAQQARRARDDLVGIGPARVDRGARAAVVVAARVSRSRPLAWSVRGLGVRGAEVLRTPGGGAVGDVWDRVRRWCEIASGAGTSETDEELVVGLRDLAELVEGAELAAARLIVASFDVRPVPEAKVPASAARGVADA
ncbi:hypothetical protein [Cellulomonas fimi]|uniref:Uncharacterized protein n=1 Tax=Cellulomonas fimi TaxID=1708 RepID=A0A7Y0LZ03_CELFI|nr:hypothetical protein [Cellulomonas fimi]NMR20008.1 hypothetical protein [Cellulomonas fimi]